MQSFTRDYIGKGTETSISLPSLEDEDLLIKLQIEIGELSEQEKQELATLYKEIEKNPDGYDENQIMNQIGAISKYADLCSLLLQLEDSQQSQGLNWDTISLKTITCPWTCTFAGGLFCFCLNFLCLLIGLPTIR